MIVKNGKIIGRGYHRCCGQNHAEVNAIADAKGKVAGSTLYVTLEPCCHSGKTPPCTDLIIRHNIRRVVIAAADSNPLVSCRGIACLENAGIEVTRGVLEAESRGLNEAFFHFMETGMPFITVKYAQTLDGRIATATGNSPVDQLSRFPEIRPPAARGARRHFSWNRDRASGQPDADGSSGPGTQPPEGGCGFQSGYAG